MKFAFTASPESQSVSRFMANPANFNRALVRPLPGPRNVNPAHDRVRAASSEQTSGAWTRYDEITWIPVVDRISRHLQDAWTAIESRDVRMAEYKLRAMAADLRNRAVAAAVEDSALCAADQRRAQNASWRLAASALRAGLAASGIASGEIRTTTDVRLTLNSATVLDINCRWLFVDEATWYPVRGEVQRHFQRANRAMVMLEGAVAATEIHKAMGFLRLEEVRTNGSARMALDSAMAQLQELSMRESPAPGAAGHPAVGSAFSSALLALAMAHRNRASESWIRGNSRRAGHDFIAAGETLGSALGWLNHRLKLAPSIVAMDFSAIGRRLVAGDVPGRGDILEVLRTFGIAVDCLQRDMALIEPDPERSAATS